MYRMAIQIAHRRSGMVVRMRGRDDRMHRWDRKRCEEEVRYGDELRGENTRSGATPSIGGENKRWDWPMAITLTSEQSEGCSYCWGAGGELAAVWPALWLHSMRRWSRPNVIVRSVASGWSSGPANAGGSRWRSAFRFWSPSRSAVAVAAAVTAWCSARYSNASGTRCSLRLWPVDRSTWSHPSRSADCSPPAAADVETERAAALVQLSDWRRPADRSVVRLVGRMPAERPQRPGSAADDRVRPAGHRSRVRVTTASSSSDSSGSFDSDCWTPAGTSPRPLPWFASLSLS